MVNIYDVIIVGGGPAGSSAAFTAASLGLHVLLIDKAKFPREKLCGGLLTMRSKKTFEDIFGQQWPQDLVTSSSNVVFQLANGERVVGPKHSTLNFTMRRVYDAHLLGLAEQAGAIVRQGVRVASLDLETNSIILSDGEHVQFRYLIGADGVNSQTAHTVFGGAFDQKTIGFGLEVEVPRSDMRVPNTDEINIDFAAANWGYGWTFPKHKTLTVGVGGIHRLNPNLRDALRRYLARSELDIEKYDVKGQYIPFGDFRAYPARDNVLLCGDAAGLVDPITGEGIAHAMKSGSIAARAIAQGIQGDWSSGTTANKYVATLEEITTSLRQANFWRWFIFPKLIQKPFAAAFADASTLQRGYLDILAGDREYTDLPRLVGYQLIKGVKKLGRLIAHSASKNKAEKD